MKVQVAREGITVRARREFVIDDGRPLAGSDDRLKALLGSVVPDTALPLRAAMLISPVAGGKVRTFVQSIVGADDAPLSGASGAAAILDASGKVVTSFTLEPAVLNDRDPRNGRVLGGARDLDPGDYRLRVAAVMPDGRAGSVETAFVARPRQAGEVSYSDLMVGLRPQAGQAFRPVPEPVVDRELLMAVELVEPGAGRHLGGAGPFRDRGDGRRCSARGDAGGGAAGPSSGDRGWILPADAAARNLRRAGARDAAGRRTRPADEALHRHRAVWRRRRPRPAHRRRPRDAAGVPAVHEDRALGAGFVAPFLDYVARAFPPGAAGAAVIEKARAGTFEVPATPPARKDAVAFALVRGLATIRDGSPSACVTAFNDTIDRADGFIGLAAFQGACYAIAGHDLDAIAAWQMALMGNVATAAIYEQIVDAQLRIGEAEAALETLAEGDLLWTDRAGFDRRRGLALALLDRHQEALPLLEAAAADPAADRELLFFVLQAMHVGRTVGWLDASPETKARFERYLERYTSQKGSQAATAKAWRKAFGGG